MGHLLELFTITYNQNSSSPCYPVSRPLTLNLESKELSIADLSAVYCWSSVESGRGKEGTHQNYSMLMAKQTKLLLSSLQHAKIQTG